jgi:pimeloyl-ACP methyl ester carboxylesterase
MMPTPALPTVVFLHGFLETPAIWQGFARKHFAEKYPGLVTGLGLYHSPA